MTMATYLERYLRGENEAVWVELLAQGAAIREGSLYEDALAVARETMRRVRRNVETLVERLTDMGYTFGVYPDGVNAVPGYTSPHTPPNDEMQAVIAALEEQAGVLPLALRVFWEVVGDVNLMGYFPGWPAYTDPLVVDPVGYVYEEFLDWRNLVEDGFFEEGPFEAPLAPDYFHKDDVSGGSPYCMRVPNPAIDGILDYERNETTLVNYLRICFEYGGFPGVLWMEGEVPEGIRCLGEGLLPV